jgi:nucleoside-diphosphate-sugar epimerase
MSKPEVLITGANGEVGHGLIKALAADGRYHIIAIDRRDMDPELESLCKAFYQGDILDSTLIGHISNQHRFHKIFHLAGLLSSSAEKDPDLGHMVNVDGSRNILGIARAHAETPALRVVFLFTPSIAAYGVRAHDDQRQPLTERQYLTPVTMYGINKLYVEQLGRYYSELYRKNEHDLIRIDFRCLRFPGLISPDTIPSGGTSDYGPEMLHAAARGEEYACFVAPETKIPFMVMHDAIRSIMMLAHAPAENMRHRIYNVTAFSVTAAQIEDKIRRHFPDARISYAPNPARQAIVDSWPDALDDSAAKQDWDWSPIYDFRTAFEQVLIPKTKERYPR